MLFRIVAISSLSAVLLAGCATQQENPFYKYSSKYQGTSYPASSGAVVQSASTVQSAPISYQGQTYGATHQAAYAQTSQECLQKEKNRELLGAGIGGTVGAIAGKKIIGGTKGTVIGAGLGGAAGYGIGDVLVNCDPEPRVTSQPQPFVSQAPATSQASIVTPASSSQSYTQGYAEGYAQGYSQSNPQGTYVSPTDSEFPAISDQGTPGYQVLQAQNDQYSVPAAQAATSPVATTIASSSSYGSQPVAYDYEANTVYAAAETAPTISETQYLQGGAYGSHLVKQGDTVYSLSRKNCVGIDEIQSLNNLDAGYSINIGDNLQLPTPRC
ncbi:LysM peptidoglycan-binding domain-containing protein [Hellea sp.]|nr:LysM peptidoglycan-binding domain-containing protein [Hellea sp.]